MAVFYGAGRICFFPERRRIYLTVVPLAGWFICVHVAGNDGPLESFSGSRHVAAIVYNIDLLNIPAF